MSRVVFGHGPPLAPVILEATEPHLAAAGFRLEGMKRPLFGATRVAVVPVETLAA